MASNRVKWMKEVVEKSISKFGEQESNEFFQEKDGEITEFLTDVTTRCIVFCYEKNKSTDADDPDSTGAAMQIYRDIDTQTLSGRCVYFMKTVPNKPINLKGGSDETLISGQVLPKNLLLNYHTALGTVYKPLLEISSKWGQLTDKSSRQQFLRSSRNFLDGWSRDISNIGGDISLVSPAEPYHELKAEPEVWHQLASDEDCVQALKNTITSWTQTLTNYLNNDPSSNADYLKKHNECLEQEIDFWSRRMLTLTQISDALNEPRNRGVLAVLREARQLSIGVVSSGSRQSPMLTQSSSKALALLPTPTPPAQPRATGSRGTASHRRSSSSSAFRSSRIVRQGSVIYDTPLETVDEHLDQLLCDWTDAETRLVSSLAEAQDNVKFLENLRAFVPPLTTESPQVLKAHLPGIVNAIKMIHTLSRHYSTDIRITNLLARLTNSIINRCRSEIYRDEEHSRLWDQGADRVISCMKSCVDLSIAYKKQYRSAKQRLMSMPKGKQFNFNEEAIFGRFDAFTRRLEKLVDIFSSIKQFDMLAQQHIDGLEGVIADFKTMIDQFRSKGHDLLDFDQTGFERDFVEFTMNNSSFENRIQEFIDKSFGDIYSIPVALELHSQFRAILHREALQTELEEKYRLIFKAYGRELQNIEDIYEKGKHNPDIPRNMPRIAGNIQWSRQLLRRITEPMDEFKKNAKAFQSKDSRKIIKHYNRMARCLIEFETLWYNAWEKSCDVAKSRLQIHLIVRLKGTNRLKANFDPAVLHLMAEAKQLRIMNFKIPPSARVVLLLESNFVTNLNGVKHMLEQYNKVVESIAPILSDIFKPHIKNVHRTLSPGMISLTWTSMSIQSFLKDAREVLTRFGHLVNLTNDIVENRIRKNLKRIERFNLADIPSDTCFSMQQFDKAQQTHRDTALKFLQRKNKEIETAVCDILEAALEHKLDGVQPTIPESEQNKVKSYYCDMLYQSVLTCVKHSLSLIKKRASSRRENLFMMETPFFQTDISLEVPNVVLQPTLDEVQDSLDSNVKAILQLFRQVCDWGVTESGDARERIDFFKQLNSEKSIAVVLMSLAGTVEHTKTHVAGHLEKFAKYSWLWTQDPETAYNQFVTEKPRTPDDYIDELRRFAAVQKEIESLSDTVTLASFNLCTETLKCQLKAECERWKSQFSANLHSTVKHDLEERSEMLKDMQTRLGREVKDFSSLKSVMDTLAEIRDAESWIEYDFNSILQRYDILEQYLPSGMMSKDEMDSKSILISRWEEILASAENVVEEVSVLQEPYQKDLLTKVTVFKTAVTSFREDYDVTGPMVEGIAPQEAITRLNKFNREFETMYRKYEMYNGGEKLFGLEESPYPIIVQTKEELRLLDSLYNLYKKVSTQFDVYKDISWTEVVAQIDTMRETVESFSGMTKKLDKRVKQWNSFVELKQSINDFLDILPLLTELAKPSIKQRHWEEIAELTGATFDLSNLSDLKLRSVIEANMQNHIEDIEEITDGADKQLTIEQNLHDLEQVWSKEEFEFGQFKERGEVILAGAKVNEIIERLEDSQASLSQMLTMRHVKPFEEEASARLKQLSNVSDMLESWIKVQMLWMSLEAVFTSGDIARQMPQDTRVFMKVDKEWVSRYTAKARDLKNVVNCCQNEYMVDILPSMFNDLESCQKALDGYLEAKRNKFPRFYFVSNPALLLILSQGSDQNAVQQCFSKIFDSVNMVGFKGQDIVSIKGISAGYDGVQDVEEIPLVKPVSSTGNIEDWLGSLEKEMCRTMRKVVRQCATDCVCLSLEEFIEKSCAQAALLGIQFIWTSDGYNALNACKTDKNAIANAIKKQSQILTTLATMTTREIPKKMTRTKVETLVTIQVHQREVLQYLAARVKAKLLKGGSGDFEWEKQLRCAWDEETDHCIVSIADVDFTYSYEYLGCKERLVVTPLTDRCYITLSQALGMFFGGAPAGPAGTGKTETVKDLARALGKYVVVFNCSDQMRYTDTAKIFKGLCQSGSWGCFDEFNRIDLEVLSVVAQQVMAILTSMRARLKSFHFPGDLTNEVSLDARCGFFITMNPGYAGRQELPENLKALFRGVAMMVPNREIIMRVKLASVGYLEFTSLAKKFFVLYALCEEQLSKQRHYDFGLRNILSVLRTAGVNLRIELKKGAAGGRAKLEEMLLMRTLRDMNLSKLVADDVGLFISLLHDLFPSLGDPPKAVYKDVEDALEKHIKESPNLVFHDSWVLKCLQLYETSLVRHGLMMIGPAGSGKSQAITTLLEALTAVRKKHVQISMNPKAIRAEEMFGENDPVSGEWTHGIFSSIWAKYNDLSKAQITWIICDGPVDAVWIENLNTVLDDNKLLTLANGDRMPMTDNVKIMFEAEDLRNASPATVSRAGIIYVSAQDLGVGPLFESWVSQRRDEEATIIRQLYAKYIDECGLFEFMLKNTHAVLPVYDMHTFTSFTNLMSALLQKSVNDQLVLPEDVIERFFIYSLVWSIGGLLEVEDRLKLNAFLLKIGRDSMPKMDEGETLYEFYVQPKSHEWKIWEPPEWTFPKVGFEFANCLIPTRDSVRAEYILKLMSGLGKASLVLGGSGTGKSSTVLQFCDAFPAEKMVIKKINFSSATTCRMFQDSIEADIEKRQGKTYAPPGGRLMTIFLDDISMPEVNTWGDQPTLEIVRQVVESDGMYFLEKDKRGDRKICENMLYVAAMSHPGGGRNDIPNRLKRHFFCFNLTPPSKTSIDNIYGSMLRGKFGPLDFAQDLIPMLTLSTIDLWQRVKAKMLPTPTKFHYIFNIRDIARVFQGVLFPPLDTITDKAYIIDLWRHECERVFCDKLVSLEDQEWYKDCFQDNLMKAFGAEVAAQHSETKYFVDFLRDDVIDPETDEIAERAPKIYERGPDLDALKERANMFLNQYNEEPKLKSMNLVLFTDAVNHMMRIARILAMPRGSALLVGVGGSGRQSLTRLAAYIANHETAQISLTRTYKTSDLLDDIRNLCAMTGKDGKSVTFIFTDSDIIDENFLEYINAILATGEIAGLFPKDEREMMCAELRGQAKKQIPGFLDTPDNLYKFFLNRIRANLHIILCFSPANQDFATRARKFPALISGCNIDWFLRWPEEALVSVSSKFLTTSDFNLECTEAVRSQTVLYIGRVHDIVVESCEEYFSKYRRHVYVTPKSYLSFIASYKSLYVKKLGEIEKQEKSVALGLKKLDDAAKDVEKMQDVLKVQKVELVEAEKNSSEMLAQLEVGAKEAEVQKSAAEKIEHSCVATATDIESEKEKANKDLQAALPFMEAATEAAKSINKADIGVIAKLPKPPDLIKRIMDCVLILMQQSLNPVKLGIISVLKEETKFILDSYNTYALPFMSGASFVPDLMNFSLVKKDLINEETMELLQPYFAHADMTPESAKKVSGAAEGLCKWVRAMASYHEASLIVAPKLALLKVKEAALQEANAELAVAKASSKKAQDALDQMQADFSKTMAEKAQIEATAKATADKMTAATNLISSLEGERVRWTADAKRFADRKMKLVGDCALSCAFVSYSGPFNHEFRARLQREYFLKDCVKRDIPVSMDLNPSTFLVDDATIAEWNSQGLPKDDLSIQNGILVTQATRWPMLIDPQAQALTWLKKREANDFPVWGTTTLNNPKLRDQLEFTMSEGKPLLIEGVQEELDPMLDPVLEKNVVKKGRSQYIVVGDKAFEFNPNFRMFFITKLSNPHFSPELSAKTTVIDFAVTQKGLEDQLLSKVINAEQKHLEEQRQKLVEEVNMNTISLLELDKLLLQRLSASEGNLLEDVALIAVLADTKTKAKDVTEKIESAKQTEVQINKKRDQYRSVATRGSVLYFVIVDMALVNWMYQTSLAQFLGWFFDSIEKSPKANIASKRVENIIDHLTFNVYDNVNRGLFGIDKLTFKLMVAIRIRLTEGTLDSALVSLLLKGGSALSPADCPKKPFDWLQIGAWMNIIALANEQPFFSDIPETIKSNEKLWRAWYEHGSPEGLEIPNIEERLQQHKIGQYMRLLLIRSMRDDRTTLAADAFIAETLSDAFVKPITTTLEEVWEVSGTRMPMLLMLTPGADPTATIEELARKKEVPIFSVSMGEGQEPHAKKCITDGVAQGGWALLQNCHLGLGFMGTINDLLVECHDTSIEGNPPVNTNFRLWITCEQHPEFPIALLQSSVKVTQEAPQGLKAGLLRSYNTIIDRDRLERIDKPEWRDSVYTICFMHSVVQERRKFGSIGFNIPYEFNQSDLQASLQFLEKHMFAQPEISWPTVQYMVCEAQYGGRITDDFDRILFNTYGRAWLGPQAFEDSFVFADIPGVFTYKVPKEPSVEKYRECIAVLPSHDSPEIFGLHANADLTFGTQTSMQVLKTILETQPKESAGSGGMTREDRVKAKCGEMLEQMPVDYIDEDVREKVRKRPKAEVDQVLGKTAGKVDGFTVPLNVFLYQEIVRLQEAIANVRSTLENLISAIDGIVIMTPRLQEALDSIDEFRPPNFWHTDASGAQTAWRLPTLGLWFQGLLDREKQLTSWLLQGRPSVYWLTGFFNPQGFLTAMRQEVTRKHKAERWALDDVVYHTEVTEYEDWKKIKGPPDEGVYIRGVYIEGCSWDHKAKTLIESKPKELHVPLPVLYVTAITNQKAQQNRAKNKGKEPYSCPVYTVPKRNDLAYIFNFSLPTKVNPMHWVLRGVAMLCSKE